LLVIPIAAFLVGALLSLLLPTLMLSALAFWYMAVIRRVPASREQPPENVEPATPDAIIEPPADASS
jgi:membrane protein implicated in regulation of membrane protease activity